MNKEMQKKVSKKIAKVMDDDSQLSQKQAVGKAMGIMRHEGVDVPKKKKRSSGRAY